MAKTTIVSEETLRYLLEAHASLAAWYYQHAEALREAQAGAVDPPDDAKRKAFLDRAGQDFPELAAVAQSVGQPRLYVPPPAVVVPAPIPLMDEELDTRIEPAAQRAKEDEPDPVT